MSGISRGVVVALMVVVAFLAVAVGAGGVVVADDHDDIETDNETDNEVQIETGPYSIDELGAGHRASENAPPSVRRWGQGQLWIRYAPTDLGASTSDPDTWRYLEPGTTIERSEVYLGGFTGWGSGEEIDVTIVYWSEETINGTAVAANQEIQETSVTLSGGYAEEPVDIRASYDEPIRATMIAEGSEGSAQWSFDIHTTRTAEPVAVDTRADLAIWIAGVLAAVGLVSLASLYVSKKFHQKAGAGPQYPLWVYGAAVVPVGFLTLTFGYRSVLNTVAEAPWVLIPFVAIATVIGAVSWWGDDVRHIAVVDFDLTDPDVHEDHSGWIDVSIETLPIAEVEGTEGVVLPGISNYLARTRGAIPELDLGGDPSVRFNGSGIADEVVFTDPFNDDPINFKKEGWSFSHVYRPPTAEDYPDDAGTIDSIMVHLSRVAWMELLVAGGIVATGYIVGNLVFASGALGALAATIPAAMWVGRPIKGSCEVDVAPAQFGSVVVALLQAGEEFEKLADREYFKEKYYSERGKNVADRKKDREESAVEKFDKVMQELESGEPEDLEGVVNSVGGADD